MHGLKQNTIPSGVVLKLKRRRAIEHNTSKFSVEKLFLYS